MLVTLHDLTCPHTSEPCDELQILNFDHVVLITHKEVLARIPPDDIVLYIMLAEPMSMHSAMNKISELSCLNSSTYAYTFTFNLIGEYSTNENFMVDHLCITCDKISELKVVVFSHICYMPTCFCCETLDKFQDIMMHSVLVDILQPTKIISCLLDCSNVAKSGSDLSYNLYLSQHMLHLYAPESCFTYICKLSCILYDVNNGHDRIPILDLFDLAYIKFDHRSSVRTLDLILNNKTVYIFGSHLDHDSLCFT